MALESFTKQNYEEFVIAGNFNENMEVGELITSQTMSARDKDNNDVTSTVIDGTTVVNDGDGRVQGLIKAGDEALAPYVVTFKCVTDSIPVHKWEIDVKMKVKET